MQGVIDVTHIANIQNQLPAKATAIDFAGAILILNTLFDVLGFFTGWTTTIFNFAINLGIFFLGEIA
jgi:hypothetical protein